MGERVGGQAGVGLGGVESLPGVRMIHGAETAAKVSSNPGTGIVGAPNGHHTTAIIVTSLVSTKPSMF